MNENPYKSPEQGVTEWQRTSKYVERQAIRPLVRLAIATFFGWICGLFVVFVFFFVVAKTHLGEYVPNPMAIVIGTPIVGGLVGAFLARRSSEPLPDSARIATPRRSE